MQSNLKLLLSYDGTHYLGWQKTPMGPSIEGTLQAALQQILQEPITLQAASRTDAGVHAHEQVVNFLTEKMPSLQKLRHQVNCLLSPDIAVKNIEEMPHSFHPTLDCRGKEYRYAIDSSPVQMPHRRFYSWHVPYPLDKTLMQQAGELLTGTHDFKAFCNFKKNAAYAHYIRTIEEITIIESDNSFEIRITGNNFLYKMVRNLVGTIAYVGRGKIGVDDLLKVLESGDRTQAGVTAPALGLTLYRVYY